MRASAAVAIALFACSSHPPHGTGPGTGSDVALPDRPPPDPAAPTLRLPTSFAPTAYRATLTIDPAQPTFAGEIQIDAKLAAPSSVIWLHAEKLTIDEAYAGSARLTATQHGAQFLALRAPAPLAVGAVHLRIRYHGAISDQDRTGAWRAQWKGAWYLFTQFEMLSARRVFPCVDEPSSKVPWQLTLVVPSGDVALSNTAAKVTTAQGGARYEFATTRPLPSYLVAFAVGPFELVDAGKTPSGKPLRIAAPAGRGADAANAAKTTSAIVGALESWFGTPFPYDKLDEVTVGNGAYSMENAGMIAYPESSVLIAPDDPSIGRKVDWLHLAGHEIAHQWFGDLVTMAWWDDAWLNEAFATWMSSKVVASLDPAAHAELDDVQQLGWALGQDEVPSARMIRQPIASEDDIYNAFDGITYIKGAAVIGMFERWVGPAKFQAGVRAYLKARADGNATTDDFLEEIGAAAGKDVGAPFRTFLEQAGAPRVTATVTCAKGEHAKVALHQERYVPRGVKAIPAQTWQVPVCVVYGDDRGGRASRECTMLAKTDDVMTLEAQCPTWLYANADASGYYRVGLSAAQLDAIASKGWRALDDGERLELDADAMASVRDGELDAGAMLALVPRLLGEKQAALIEAAVVLGRRVQLLVPSAQRAGYEAWVRTTYGPLAAKLGWRTRKGDGEDAARSRS
jgi:alanyl aminopeptidase